MRDYSTNRAGFDRILMAVAATFLTVSTSAAFAQTDTAKKSASELAIDAAVPMPEPANVPPPTAADFKPVPPAAAQAAATKAPDAKASDIKASDAKPATSSTSTDVKSSEAKPADVKPADVATAPASDTKKDEVKKDDTANTAPVAPPAATAAAPTTDQTKEPVKAASNVAPADQPVADKLHDLFDAKSA
jgi:hypothetical protein